MAACDGLQTLGVSRLLYRSKEQPLRRRAEYIRVLEWLLYKEQASWSYFAWVSLFRVLPWRSRCGVLVLQKLTSTKVIVWQALLEPEHRRAAARLDGQRFVNP